MFLEQYKEILTEFNISKLLSKSVNRIKNRADVTLRNALMDEDYKKTLSNIRRQRKGYLNKSGDDLKNIEKELSIDWAKFNTSSGQHGAPFPKDKIRKQYIRSVIEPKLRKLKKNKIDDINIKKQSLKNASKAGGVVSLVLGPRTMTVDSANNQQKQKRKDEDNRKQKKEEDKKLVNRFKILMGTRK